MAKKWIQGANIKAGALTRKAKAAGMTISAYCGQKNLSGKTKRQCNLAKTFRGMR